MQRKTQQRKIILEALRESDRPMSPGEILESAQKIVPGIGIATIYRAIKDFLEEGWIEVVELPGTSDRYEMSGKHHHHHFWCRSCDRVYEVDGCSGRLNIRPPRGFIADFHEIIFKGLCVNCS